MVRRNDPELLDRTIGRIREISSLPAVVEQMTAVVASDRSSADDLRVVVEADPALAARMLRTVNSAAYGLAAPVHTIHKAICYLGFNEVKNLALTASIAPMFRAAPAVGGYDRRGLWRHSVAVAVAARTLAARLGNPRTEEAFLAGLLHDVGVILMDQYLHPAFTQIVAAFSPQRPLWEIEFEIVGFNHTDLGAGVAERWRLPAGPVDAIRHHHRADLCTGDNRCIVQMVEVANYVCTKFGYSATGICPVGAPSTATLSAIQLRTDDLVALTHQLPQELEKRRSLFDLVVEA